METIGQRIKRERLLRNLTQRDLAEKVNVGAPHISKIEAGREIPSDDLLDKIASALDCDFEELLLVAKRMPPDLMESFASDPQRSLEFLRRWKDRDS
ncbi:MAG: helix-turn-helix transcriptional regulator [Chloroflexi bacterium]|nr:helix-turn-helix transcriptional regulator [Chloroflexota bacterium]